MTAYEARVLKPGLYRLQFAGWHLDTRVAHRRDGSAYFVYVDEIGEPIDSNAWSYVSSAVPLITFPLTPGMSQAQQLAAAVLQGNADAIPGLLDEAEAEFHNRPGIEERIAEAIESERMRLVDIVIDFLVETDDENRWNLLGLRNHLTNLFHMVKYVRAA